MPLTNYTLPCFGDLPSPYLVCFSKNQEISPTFPQKDEFSAYMNNLKVHTEPQLTSGRKKEVTVKKVTLDTGSMVHVT